MVDTGALGNQDARETGSRCFMIFTLGGASSVIYLAGGWRCLQSFHPVCLALPVRVNCYPSPCLVSWVGHNNALSVG